MFALYARRSSDRDDQQALSLESQVTELRKLAEDRGIKIGEEFTESASAKDPGRPVFNQLMKQVRDGKIKGILVWRLDRLARNMVDGGAIIYELSEGRPTDIVTPEATYTDTGDAKFVLAMQFGMAAQFEDDLSAGVKRGSRKVLKRGKLPGGPPIGYLKNPDREGATVPVRHPLNLGARFGRLGQRIPRPRASGRSTAGRSCMLLIAPCLGAQSHPASLTSSSKSLSQ